MAANKKTTKKKVIAKKKATTKKKVTIKKKPSLYDSLLELVRVTSTVLPDDVARVLLNARKAETEGSSASYALGIIADNIELAKIKSSPICQDTGTLLFFVNHPVGFKQSEFIETAKKAVVKATQVGYLRQNSVDSLTGANTGMNVGPGHPSFHFHEHKSDKVEIRLVLKGGGSENVSTQYSLPNVELGAGRDLEGVKKVILDGVIKAQGKGCGPGILGVCIGGDRGAGYINSKEQLLRKLDDKNPSADLNKLENEIVEISNKLGIGPMGFGGATTLIGCKIGVLNRLPASFFVSISYMCWASRRQGVVLTKSGDIKNWLY